MLRSSLLLLLLPLAGCLLGYQISRHFDSEDLRERLQADACHMACTRALIASGHLDVTGYALGDGCGCRFDDDSRISIPLR